jgi:hypothetical protein
MLQSLKFRKKLKKYFETRTTTFRSCFMFVHTLSLVFQIIPHHPMLNPSLSISLSYDFENIPRTDFIPARGDFSLAPFLSVSFIDAFEVEDLWR